MAARHTLPMQRPKRRAARPATEGYAGAHALIWGDHTDRRGSRPLLLLHGLPQRPDVFEPIAGRLARLGVLPIAPYLYGHLYKRPEGPNDYQLARFLDNALSVADRLELEHFDVLGIGLGAAVGWMLAGRYPGRVSWLASIQFPHPAAAAAKDVRLGVEGEERQRMTHERQRMTDSLLRWRRTRVRELLIEQGLPRYHLELYVERLSAPGALEAALAWNAPQPPEELPQLNVPVLLVSNAGGHPTAPHRIQQLVPPGLTQEAVLEGTRFPLEAASTELMALLEKHLPQR